MRGGRVEEGGRRELSYRLILPAWISLSWSHSPLVSLISRPFLLPAFDHLQYAKIDGRPGETYQVIHSPDDVTPSNSNNTRENVARYTVVTLVKIHHLI